MVDLQRRNSGCEVSGFERDHAQFLLFVRTQAQGRQMAMESRMGMMPGNIGSQARFSFEPVFKISSRNPAALFEEMESIVRDFGYTRLALWLGLSAGVFFHGGWRFGCNIALRQRPYPAEFVICSALLVVPPACAVRHESRKNLAKQVLTADCHQSEECGAERKGDAPGDEKKSVVSDGAD